MSERAVLPLSPMRLVPVLSDSIEYINVALIVIMEQLDIIRE